MYFDSEGRELSSESSTQNNIEKSRNWSNYNGLAGFSNQQIKNLKQL